MFGKKAQMIHQGSSLDLVIVLIGLIIGIFLVYYGLNHGMLPVSSFCPAPVEAAI